MMCELLAGLLEHAALQRKNLPGEFWEECWRNYTYERFDSSPALREFWRDNPKLYALTFRTVVNFRPHAKA